METPKAVGSVLRKFSDPPWDVELKRAILKNNNVAFNIALPPFFTSGLAFAKYLTHIEVIETNSEAKRLLRSGAIRINRNTIDEQKPIYIQTGQRLSVGKLWFEIADILRTK